MNYFTTTYVKIACDINTKTTESLRVRYSSEEKETSPNQNMISIGKLKTTSEVESPFN